MTSASVSGPASAAAGSLRQKTRPYAVQLERALREQLRAKPLKVGPGPLFARRVGAKPTVFVLTRSVGRLPREAAELPADLRRVELIAQCAQPRPEIGELLSALASLVAGSALKPYDSVSLEAPQHGLQHFDLLPGGELRLDGGVVIHLLRVVPLRPAELQERDTAGDSQWVGSYAAGPGDGGDRWLKLLPPAEASDAP